MNRNDVKLIETKLCFKQYRTVEEIRYQHASLDPSNTDMLPETSREIFNGASAAQVLLYNPEKDAILFNTQFRIGPYIAGEENPWLIECAAGMIDPGEEPEQTAIREAYEETGATVTKIEKIGRYYTSPGGLTEELHLYCGLCDPIEDNQIKGFVEEGEEILTKWIPVSDIPALIEQGEFLHGMTVLAFYWFEKNYDRLKKEWSK